MNPITPIFLKQNIHTLNGRKDKDVEIHWTMVSGGCLLVGKGLYVWTCLGLYQLFFLGYRYNAEKTSYSLRVIPTLTHYSDIFSDIPSGVYNILDIHIYILTFFLDLASIYSDILSAILSDILFWHSIWHGHSDGFSLNMGSCQNSVNRDLARCPVRSGTRSWDPRLRGSAGGGGEGNNSDTLW